MLSHEIVIDTIKQQTRWIVENKKLNKKKKVEKNGKRQYTQFNNRVTLKQILYLFLYTTFFPSLLLAMFCLCLIFIQYFTFTRHQTMCNFYCCCCCCIPWNSQLKLSEYTSKHQMIFLCMFCLQKSVDCICSNL